MNHREALRTLAAGSAAGALAGGVAVMAMPAAIAAETVSHDLAVAIGRHRMAVAAYAALAPHHTAAEEAAGRGGRNVYDDPEFRRIDDTMNAAIARMVEVMDAIVAVPIASVADMRAKAAYLAQVMPGTCDHNGTMAALLASMGGTTQVSDLTPVHDPMREAVEEYEAAYALQGKMADAEDWSACEAIYAKRIGPAEDAIHAGPTVTTLAGAIAAVRYVATSENMAEEGPATALRAVLAYFDGRA